MPTVVDNQMLILDTHVWVWLMEGTRKLKPSVRKQIQKCVPDNSLGISAISVWEIAMLESRGRIVFNEECSEWVNMALSAPGISLIPLSPKISIAATRLPGDIHGDPADRIIVATARSCGGILVTADRFILDYSKNGHVRTISAV